MGRGSSRRFSLTSFLEIQKGLSHAHPKEERSCSKKCKGPLLKLCRTTQRRSHKAGVSARIKGRACARPAVQKKRHKGIAERPLGAPSGFDHSVSKAHKVEVGEGDAFRPRQGLGQGRRSRHRHLIVDSNWEPPEAI